MAEEDKTSMKNNNRNIVLLIVGTIVMVIILLAIFGGIYYSRQDNNTQMETKVGEESSSTNSTDEESDDVFSDGDIKTFDLTAKQWEFNPSTITVSQGDLVILNITSVDVTHGFAIPDFNVNETLRPNTSVTVEFVADKKGTFRFFCSVACGSGHLSMDGTLTVE